MNELINELERRDATQLEVERVAYATLWTRNLSTPKTKTPGQVESAFRVSDLHASHVDGIPASI